MIADIYELSPLQAGMLFHRVFAPASRAYFDQFACRLTGEVDPARLRRAWQQLVDRHAVLRTSFHWEGLDRPVQVVHAQAALPWEEMDWRGIPAEEHAARWQAWLEADRARGFAPDVAPLMRAAVARVADREYYFCWSHHHLLLDGWCLSLVLSELFERYDALGAGRAPRLAPVRPYSEYIAWLRGRDRAALEQYWRETLAGVTTPTAILPAARDTAGDRVDAVAERSLGTDLSAALQAAAARHRLTLNTLVQGAWALLLSRYSGSGDVVFGTTVSGRPPDLPGVETMLGVFINTVPVRLRVDGAANAAAWLAGVQAEHVAREQFAAIPLSDIQKLSDIEPGTPLFDTNVIVMNYRLDGRLVHGAAGLSISDVRTFDQTETPLTLQVTPGRETALEMLYDGARFETGAVERMLGHVAHLLAQFSDGLDRPLDAFELLSEAERTQLLETFNATGAPLDVRETALDLWDARVRETPDAIAVECEGRRLTFGELDAWSDRLAAGLRQLSPRPIEADALVAIAFHRSERLPAAVLAIWKCGAAYVPIDPDYPPERIRQVIAGASPRLVLRDPGSFDASIEDGDAGALRYVSVEEVERAAAEAAPAVARARRAEGRDLAYVIFTSGSTGVPKGAMVEHTGMLNHLLAKIEDFALDRSSVLVQNASHCFDISVWQCFAAMLAGGRTLIYTDALVLEPARFLQRVRDDRVTVLEVVPSYLGALLDVEGDTPARFDDLRMLVVTGETVKPALVERWFARYRSIPMVNAYGPTEASDDITHAFMHEAPATPTVPVGRPIRNFRIYIVDDQMRLCPIGVAGEVCVSGPGVGRGYLGDPARTALAFLEDPFRAGQRMYRTGDVGWFDETGTVFLAGRKDHQVKVRGYRIELGEIESALTRLDVVRDAVVVERRDRGAGGAYLAAYVSLRDPAISGAQILDALSARLPDYMVPSTCTVLAELPLTPNGKIDRKALPAPAHGPSGRDAAFTAPRTDAERAIAAIWADVLGVDRPGLDDNFFAAGGDSILSMQIVSRAARAGLALTPRDVFQHQTIGALAAAARPLEGQTPDAAPAPRGPAPLAPAQQQFFADVTVDRHHYNQSILLEVPPGFDAARASLALDAVVRHHDALRLRFAQVDGEWRQTVAPPGEGVAIETHSIADVAPDDRAAAIAAIGTRVQASLDIGRGPILRAAFIDAGAGQSGRLLIAAHHLAVDGVSWRVLLEDLAEADAALERGAAIVLPLSGAPYLAYASAVAPRAAAPAADVELPTDAPFDASRNTVADAAEIAFELDEPRTRTLLTLAPQVFEAGPADLLIAAAARALGHWAARTAVAIDVETHGRDAVERLDVSRTIGWFTSTRTLSLPLTTDLSGAVTGAKTARERAFANGAPAMPRAAVLFNYHGRVDGEAHGGWRLSSDPHGADRSPRQQREYLVEINGLVTGGRLRVTIGFSSALHTADTAAALGRRLETELAAFLDHARGRSALAGLLARLPEVDDVYALSPTQHGLLFHGLLDETRGAYFNQLTCVLDGALAAAAFRQAWDAVIARHPVLRTSFHWEDLDAPVQAVHATASMPWTIDDWSALPPDEQQRRWVAAGEDDRRRPFDLTAPPLMRATLVRIGETSHLFRWSQHHLLLDGWSASIVLDDVLTAYGALLRGDRIDLKAPGPYREYIDWLRERDAEGARAFWRRHLEGIESPTPLVIGLPEMEGRVQSGLFGEAGAELTAPQASRLKAIAAAQHVTLNTLFQGVWAMLLARYSGEADVVFGAIHAGRPPALAGADRMVGLFINTVPVRARVDEQRAVFDWLRELQREGLERETWSHAPLADVQRASAVPGGTPLFETILIFENYPVASSRAPADGALAVRDVEAREPNNYALTLVVTPGETIGLKIMFDAGRFDRATIDRMLGHVMTLVDGIVEAPDSPTGALPLLTQAEHAQLGAWNDTARPLPDGETVLSLFEAHAAGAPDRIALIAGGERVTYGELDARATRLARVIARTREMPAGARVIVLLRRSARLPETVLALWKCGAAYVPLDPGYPLARILQIVDDARPALVVADGREIDAPLAVAIRSRAPLVLIDADAGPDAGETPAALARIDLSSLAYVIYTSGSTGAPKGAMLEHRGLLNHVLAMAGELKIAPGTIVAQTASHGFDISMWQMFAALASGGTTALYADSIVAHPARLADAFERDRVSIAQFVPSYLNVFLDALEQDPSRPPLAALRQMIVIGEALTAATIARWFQLYPSVPLMNAYGPTEASDSVAHAVFTEPIGEALVPIGRPIQNIRLHVVDRAMRPCPVGVKGEICIAGAGVGRGYLFDPVKTNAAFVDDPFAGGAARMYRTGDIGCVRPDGALLFFGRRDHQVKVRGHRIELGEIEACLASLDGVRDAAAVVSAKTGAPMICAYVTPRAGAALDEEALVRALSARLPHHALPDVVRVLPDLPVMPNGKVDRRALAARDIVRDAAPAAAGPETETERTIARVWSGVLGRDVDDVDRSFFDLGGHSLTAIQLAGRLSRACGVEVGVGDIFERPTIRQMAARVASASAAGSADIAPVPESDDYDVSPVQARMWLACRAPEGSAAYNMAAVFALDGDVDAGALRQAFHELVARHEALRTVFLVRGGALRQRVLGPAALADVFRVIDRAGAPPAAVDAAIAARIAEPFDLERGPLFDAELVRVADARHVLLVRLHHLAGDAASIRILLTEALALYAAARAGAEPPKLRPLPVQYKDFAAWQRARLAQGALARSRRYWLDTLDARMPRVRIAPDREAPAGETAGSVTARAALDDALAAGVRALAAREQTTVFGVMVSAIYALLHRYTGEEDLVIGSTVSRRDHPAFEDQVGCYIDTIVLRGRAAPGDTAAELVARTGCVCREALAHRDYPFDALIDDMRPAPAESRDPESAPGRPPLFDVLVDFVPGMGAMTGAAQQADLAITERAQTAEAAHYDTMFLIDEGSDDAALAVRMVMPAARYTQETADRAADRLLAILRWLAAVDGRPLSGVELLPGRAAPARRLQVSLNTD